MVKPFVRAELSPIISTNRAVGAKETPRRSALFLLELLRGAARLENGAIRRIIVPTPELTPPGVTIRGVVYRVVEQRAPGEMCVFTLDARCPPLTFSSAKDDISRAVCS
jgi:hypothetical protein